MIRNDLQWITAWANVARLLPALPGACLKVQRRGLGSWLPSVAGCNGCSAIASVLEIVWSTALQPTDEDWDLVMGAVPYGIAGKPPTKQPIGFELVQHLWSSYHHKSSMSDHLCHFGEKTSALGIVFEAIWSHISSAQVSTKKLMRHVPPKAGGLPVPHAISIALGGFNPSWKIWSSNLHHFPR